MSPGRNVEIKNILKIHPILRTVVVRTNYAVFRTDRRAVWSPETVVVISDITSRENAVLKYRYYYYICKRRLCFQIDFVRDRTEKVSIHGNRSKTRSSRVWNISPALDSRARGEFRREYGSCPLRNLTDIYIYMYITRLLLARAETYRSRPPRKRAF